MSDKTSADAADLEIRHVVAADPARVFAAWTDPDELRQWWGPQGVKCIAAEINLRVGGQYRIGNQLPDKSVVWIEGIFEVIEVPNLLEYTWSTNPEADYKERVSVRFEAVEIGTEIVICHRRIPTEAIRENHQQGWMGCLDGLNDYLQGHRR